MGNVRAAGNPVEVEFANQKKSAMADADGKWAVWLSPMKASANPRDLKVYENGEEAAKIKNVVVGELWILGGRAICNSRSKAPTTLTWPSPERTIPTCGISE